MRDFGLHVGQFLLNELIGGERAAELLAVERVLPGRMPTEFCRPHGAPTNAEAGIVEAGKGGCEATRTGQPLPVGDEDIVHDNLPSGRGAHRKLAFYFRGCEARSCRVQG